MTITERAAQLIAQQLTAGQLKHPTATIPPITPFKTAGMPSEMVKTVTATTQLMAEAMVHAITEGGISLIEAAELEHLQNTAKQIEAQPADNVTVKCRCGKPLVRIRVTGDLATIDGSHLTQCQH